jgi:hypothetical protein
MSMVADQRIFGLLHDASGAAGSHERLEQLTDDLLTRIR